MAKVNVYSLTEKMPLYVLGKGLPATQESSEIEDSLSEWINRRHKTGKLGEKIAYNFLQGKFSNVTPALKDSYGYDIQADNQYFEVKTSTSKRRDFIVTINELKTADKHKENYHIFYIMLDKVKSEAVGYIIGNPLESFEISLSELFQSTQKGNVCFDAVVYKIQLGDFLDAIEKIDLSDILRKVENKQHSKK